MRRSHFLFLSLVMLPLLAGRALGQTSGIINACVNRFTGAVRVANNCNLFETRLSWNQQGAPGPAGPPGPQGPAGTGVNTVVDSQGQTLGTDGLDDGGATCSSDR